MYDRRYKRIEADFEGGVIKTSKELSFTVNSSSDYFTTFPSEAVLVVDAKVSVVYTEEGKTTEITENLWPERHGITLPLNGLNSIFNDCRVSINQQNVNSDR